MLNKRLFIFIFITLVFGVGCSWQDRSTQIEQKSSSSQSNSTLNSSESSYANNHESQIPNVQQINPYNNNFNTSSTSLAITETNSGVSTTTVATPSPTPTPVPVATPTVIVYKADGSDTFDISSGLSLEAGASELDGIKIFSQKKLRNENAAFASEYQNDTGLKNAYEIAASDLAQAQAMGFKKQENNLVAESDCKALLGSRTMVAITFGQSNVANGVPTPSPVVEGVFNYFGGHCYRALDPMLGTSGNRGSVWTRLGAKLIQSGKYDKVIFITIAVGGSAISSWVPGGPNHRFLAAAIEQLKNSGLEVTHLLWHQGETDGAMRLPAMFYTIYFNSMLQDIRNRGVLAPIYVCIASYMMGMVYPEIEIAQMQLVNESQKIRQGVNTDSLGAAYRQPDNVHFSDYGAEVFAAEWAKIL